MEGEHGEFGHWQYESTWWDEKVKLPFYLCLPGQDMSDYQVPELASQVDIAPTYLSQLKVSLDLFDLI